MGWLRVAHNLCMSLRVKGDPKSWISFRLRFTTSKKPPQKGTEPSKGSEPHPPLYVMICQWGQKMVDVPFKKGKPSHTHTACQKKNASRRCAPSSWGASRSQSRFRLRTSPERQNPMSARPEKSGHLALGQNPKPVAPVNIRFNPH